MKQEVMSSEVSNLIWGRSKSTVYVLWHGAIQYSLSSRDRHVRITSISGEKRSLTSRDTSVLSNAEAHSDGAAVVNGLQASQWLSDELGLVARRTPPSPLAQQFAASRSAAAAATVSVAAAATVTAAAASSSPSLHRKHARHHRTSR